MKRIWQEKRKAAGKSIHEPGPNIVMGANAQVALEKFARYFEVECRLVPVSVESHYRLDATKIMDYVDENTIGVFVILGSKCKTTVASQGTVSFRSKARILDITNLSRRSPIFSMTTKNVLEIQYLFMVCFQSEFAPQILMVDVVDGASGGFVAPFATVSTRRSQIVRKY